MTNEAFKNTVAKAYDKLGKCFRVVEKKVRTEDWNSCLDQIRQLCLKCRDRIVSLWKTGPKGKVVVSVSVCVLLLLLKSCFSDGRPRPLVIDVLAGDKDPSEDNNKTTKELHCWGCSICGKRFQAYDFYGHSDGVGPCKKGHGHSWKKFY